MKLILFDVDGTLVNHFHAGDESFVFAIKNIFDIDVKKPGVEFSGWTDKGIIFEMLGKTGIDRDEITKKIDELYENKIDYVKNNINRDKDFKLLPGVGKLLESLGKDHLILGLLTGNVEKIAHIKMQKFGIDHYCKQPPVKDWWHSVGVELHLNSLLFNIISKPALIVS